ADRASPAGSPPQAALSARIASAAPAPPRPSRRGGRRPRAGARRRGPAPSAAGESVWRGRRRGPASTARPPRAAANIVSPELDELAYQRFQIGITITDVVMGLVEIGSESHERERRSG